MPTNERREEIVIILKANGFKTMSELARKFNVTTRTIRRDILVLTENNDLHTIRGRRGGVEYRGNHRPVVITMEEKNLLMKVYETLDENEKKILQVHLDRCGTPIASSKRKNN